MKLIAFQDYFNTHRSHAALKGQTPIETPESKCQLQILSLTETLPRSISDANPSVTNNSPPTPSMTCCCLWFGPRPQNFLFRLGIVLSEIVLSEIDTACAAKYSVRNLPART